LGEAAPILPGAAAEAEGHHPGAAAGAEGHQPEEGVEEEVPLRAAEEVVVVGVPPYLEREKHFVKTNYLQGALKFGFKRQVQGSPT